MASKRLVPTKETLNLLFALSGNQCAFPGCEQKLFNKKNKFIGQVCHIAAASDGGERANVNMTPEERRKQENLLILCYPHHIETDDIDEYTVGKLKKMKKDHEEIFRGVIKTDDFPPSIIDDMFNVEMRRMQEQVSETLENTKVLLGNDIKQNAVNDEMLNGIANIIARLDNSRSAAPTNFSDEINAIMELRASKQQESAYIALERLKARDWDKMSDHERYRTLANMGIILLELDQQQKAGDLFIEAFGYENNTIRALGIGALGYILKQNRSNAEECIERAWSIDPLNTDAWYAYIMLNKETIPYQELVEKIPDEVKKDVEVANGLAQAAAANNLYSEANKWAQVALDNSSINSFDNKVALATSLMQSLMNPYEVLSEQVSENVKVKIQYVIQLFTEAWDEVKNTALSKSRAWWLINRGVAHKFFPDREAAYQDMLESCQHNETYNSLRHLAIAAMDVDRLDKAIEAADKMINIGGSEKKDEADLFKIELISKKGDYSQAKTMLQDYLKRDLDETNRYHATLRLENTYQALKDFEGAKALNSEILSQFPQRIRPYINKGKYAGNPAEMKIELEKAIAVIDDHTDPNEIYDLVYWLQQVQDYKSAGELMERITNTYALSAYTKELLEIYDKEGNTGKLLALTESLLETYGPNEYLTEYKAVVFQRIGDYKQAIETCQQYLEIYPDDQLIMIRLGILYDRAGRLNELKTMLSTIQYVDMNLPFDIQENLGLLYLAIGDFEGFNRTIYEIRRQFYENGKIHQRYVSLMLKPKNRTQGKKIELVDKDSAVIVKMKDGKHETFILEDRKDPHPINGEINLTDPIAVALMGKPIGTQMEISLPSGINEFEIVGIISKYDHAIQESLHLLTGKFLATSEVVKFQVGNTGNPIEDLKPMTDIFEGGKELHQNLTFYYSRGMLSLGFISALTNRPVIDIWRQYVIDEGLGLINQTFTPEQQTAFDQIKENNLMVFDAISLVTILLSDSLEEIALLKNKKLVTQSTFQEIKEQISRLSEIKDTGITHLKSENGQILDSYESPETIQQQIKNFQLLQEWIQQNCEIVPVTAAINLNARKKQEMNDDVGESFIDSILTADEVKGLFIGEEKLLRAYASQHFGLNCGNFFTIISYLKDKREISNSRYQTISLNLIQMKYKLVPVDADLLFDLLKSIDYQVNQLFVDAALGINSSLILGDLAIKVAVDLFYKLYTETSGIVTTLTGLRFKMIIQQLINVLRLKFKEGPLKGRLLDLLQSKFRLLPLQFDELKNILNEQMDA